jgi:hypothetical protein
MDYTEDVEKNGVTFYRFAGTRKMFASASENPDNWCFCSGGTCNPSGVTNSTTCRYGSPAFVSFPHYYEADTFFQNQVEGLNPQKDSHQFHVDLEPVVMQSHHQPFSILITNILNLIVFSLAHCYSVTSSGSISN